MKLTDRRVNQCRQLTPKCRNERRVGSMASIASASSHHADHYASARRWLLAGNDAGERPARAMPATQYQGEAAPGAARCRRRWRRYIA